MEPNEKKKLVTYGAIAVADPDLQLRGGSRRFEKHFFLAPRASVCFKNKWEARAPSAGSATGLEVK